MKINIHPFVVSLFLISCNKSESDVGNQNTNTSVEKKHASDTLDKSSILYRVAIWKSPKNGIVPVDVVNNLYQIGGISVRRQADSTSTYYSTAFSSKEQCDSAMLSYKEYNFEDTYLVIDYKNQIHDPAEFVKLIWP